MAETKHRTSRPLGLGVGLVLTGLVAALVLGALWYPPITGRGVSPVERADQSAERSADALFREVYGDAATLDYIGKLRRTFPAAATDLEERVRRAVGRGADSEELGLIVLQAGARDIASSADRLARADTRHIDALFALVSNELEALKVSGAPYCIGSDLVRFAGLSEQQLYRAIFERARHGEALYDFVLAANGIMLDAIQDARQAPVLRSQLTAADMKTLQTLGLDLFTNPSIVRLLTMEGRPRTAMDEVLAETDFCALATTILNRIDQLPVGTKGRLWSETMLQLESGRWRYTLYRLTGY